jgi:hypothetical protein
LRPGRRHFSQHKQSGCGYRHGEAGGAVHAVSPGVSGHDKAGANQ